MSKKQKFILVPGKLELKDLELLMKGGYEIVLEQSAEDKINHCRKFLESAIDKNEVIYGVNTGFGLLAKESIDINSLSKLQENIILSHACGVGEYLSAEITRLILVLKINSLSLGYSGIKLATIEELIDFYNQDVLPCIPEKGSVGASGDLAPLAHLVTPLLGYGNVLVNNKILSAKDWLQVNNKPIYKFEAKEGLALLNGTQVTTALAIYSFFKIRHIFKAAIHVGALSVDAVCGSKKSFDKLISVVRNQPAQTRAAQMLYDLLEGSEINQNHANSKHACYKVQDPYSLRCQPQVMGACLQQINTAEEILSNEINSVTDNPLIFSEEEKILFGGNFHAEPIGFIADNLALVLAEIGSISERRVALMIDTNFSDLPPFLVESSGLNSGFMIAQVTAASLVSENKALATPCVIDSIPTSANQEDHVSMATYGARRLISMTDNCYHILGIELLAAAQGIEFKRPLKTSNKLEQLMAGLREHVKFFKSDRYFHEDLVNVDKFIRCYKF